VWNVLHERVAVIVANPEHVKARRGEKTDPEEPLTAGIKLQQA